MYLLGSGAEDYLEDLPIAKAINISDESQISEAIDKIGFPMVVKIISDKAIHKTEIGGVKVAHCKEEFYEIYKNMNDILKEKNIDSASIMLQEFVPGEWVYIGLKKDPVFGPVIMCGIGGIYVEVIKDISFRMCPINKDEADKMIKGLKYNKIILGSRGKTFNIDMLKDIIVKISNLPSKYDIKELDINPIIINEKECKIVDARVMI